VSINCFMRAHVAIAGRRRRVTGRPARLRASSAFSAVALMNAIIAAARDRNYAAHAAWGDFERGADEPTMTARALKAKKAGIIEVDDRRITLSMVKQALEECNRLNREMTHFTNLLASLVPPPASVLRM
jgi:hypothetical protein